MKNTRKLFSIILTLAIILTTVSAAGLSASAEEKTAQSVYWSYDNSTDTLTISDTPGNGRQEFTAEAQRWADVYTMPWNIEGKWYSYVKTVIIDGNPRPASTAEWFANAANLTEIENLKNLDTSCVESMKSMFNACKKLTSIDVSAFDTSKVTSFFGMFGYCTNLTELDLSSFDVSNAIEISNMFSTCKSLKQLDLSSFQLDYNKVIDSRGLFMGCESLETLYLFHIDTAKIKSTERMFSGCSSLKTIYAPCTSVFTRMISRNTFSGCENLVGDKGSSYVTYADVTDVFRFDGGEEAPGFFSVMHSLTKHAGVPVTCTADGVADYYSCDDCGKLFSDSDANNEIREPVVLASNGHVDSDNDGKCDFCFDKMTGDGHCDWCGKIHNMKNPIEIATAALHGIINVCMPVIQKIVNLISGLFSAIK